MKRTLALLAILVLPFAVACDDDAGANPTPASAPASAATTAPAPESSPVMPVAFADKDNKTVNVKDVSRIVPLNGDITEVVYALGLGSNVVGADISPRTRPKRASCPASATSARSRPRASSLSTRP